VFIERLFAAQLRHVALVFSGDARMSAAAWSAGASGDRQPDNMDQRRALCMKHQTPRFASTTWSGPRDRPARPSGKPSQMERTGRGTDRSQWYSCRPLLNVFQSRVDVGYERKRDPPERDQGW